MIKKFVFGKIVACFLVGLIVGSLLVGAVSVSADEGTTLFEDDFSELNLNNWIISGSPSPRVLASVEGRTGVFDNNGDGWCDNNAVSKDTFSFPKGFTMESDVYVSVTNMAGCWDTAAIAVTRNDATPYEPTDCPGEYYYNFGVRFRLYYAGDACWCTPPELRRHAYFDLGLYTEDESGEGENYINADDYINGWHNLKIIVGEDRFVSFYCDDDLIYTSEKRIHEDALQNEKIYLGERSSGSTGKVYHDYIKLTLTTEATPTATPTIEPTSKTDVKGVTTSAVDTSKFNSAVSTELGKAVDMNTLYQRANQLYEVIEHDELYIVWKFTGTTGDYAFVFADGRLMVASSANFNLAAKDTLEEELNNLIDLKNTIVEVTDAEREYAVDHAKYYASEAGVYQRIKYKYNRDFKLNLNVPEWTIKKARLTVKGGDHSDCCGFVKPGQGYLIDGNMIVSCCSAPCRTGSGCGGCGNPLCEVSPTDITNIILPGVHTVSAQWIDSNHIMVIEATTAPSEKKFVLHSDDYKTWIEDTTQCVSRDYIQKFIIPSATPTLTPAPTAAPTLTKTPTIPPTPKQDDGKGGAVPLWAVIILVTAALISIIKAIYEWFKRR